MAWARKGLLIVAMINAVTSAQVQRTAAAPAASDVTGWADVADMGKELDIHVGNKLNYRTVSLTAKQVPSFDKDDAGEAANPAADYRFSPRAIHDPFRNIVYFSVYNSATAGNANADRALFSYSVVTGAIAGPLSIREMSVSYGILALSPDGRYLAFSDGGHGGMCADTLGITVLNLETKNEVDRVFLPADSIGGTDFVAWTGPHMFKYRENTWRNREDCLNSPDNPAVAEKVRAVN